MRWRSLLLPFLIHFSCVLAIAQRVTGDLQFRVTDSLGQPVTGVNVSVTGPQVQGVRGTISDNLGYCNVLALPPGNVVVRVSHAAYQQVTFEQVPIQLGKTATLGEVRMRPKTVEMAEVIVAAMKSSVDLNTTAYGGSLQASGFADLPVDRNYKSIISLLPQANTSYYGDEVNIAGGTGYENQYFVDGIEVTNPVLGASGVSLPYNFVQEIEVKDGGYGAEFRSALGGILNAVTYSGNNELHGSAFGFYTNNRFAGHRSRGLQDPTQGGFSNYDAGFGIRGPIVRDRLWFSIAYNPTFALHDVYIPGFGVSVDRTLVHSLAAKLNWNASEKLRLSLTAVGDPTVRGAVGRLVGVPPAGLTTPDSYFEDYREGGVDVSLNGSYSVGRNLLLDASLVRVMRVSKSDPSTALGRQEVFFVDHSSDIWSGGPFRRFNYFGYSTTGRLNGTLLAGAHRMKGGIEYKVKGVDQDETDNTIDKYDDTTYQEYIGRFIGKIHDRISSLFLQDTWQISHRIRILAGIRWEGQYIVGSNGEDLQGVFVPIQPRVGITYSLNEDGTQKVFGSFGRYSQELALWLSLAYHTNQGYEYTINYNHDPRVSRAGGDTIWGFPHTIAPEVQDLRGQFFDEFSLGYERSIAGGVRLSVQGVYRALREAIDDVWFPSESTNRFGNPGSGLLSEWPRPRRDYTAIVLSIEQQHSEDFNYRASYTLSREYGNYEGLYDAIYRNVGPNGNASFNDLASSRQNATGLLPNDRTHVFKLSGSYRILPQLATGISVVVESGTPLSEFVYLDHGVRYLTPRGTVGRMPGIWDLGARVTYELSFVEPGKGRLVLDVFHIASQRKPVDVDQSRGYVDAYGNLYANSTFGQAYRYQLPMSARLGVEVSF